MNPASYWNRKFDSRGAGRQPCKVCGRPGKEYLGNLKTGVCWSCRKERVNAEVRN